MSLGATNGIGTLLFMLFVYIYQWRGLRGFQYEMMLLSINGKTVYPQFLVVIRPFLLFFQFQCLVFVNCVCPCNLFHVTTVL